MVCGQPLKYQTHGKELSCMYCRKTFTASIYCPEGHYVCDTFHGEGYYTHLQNEMYGITSKNPMEIAEKLLQLPLLPSLGAEHHAVVTIALLTALKNYGLTTLLNGEQRTITDDDINEGLRRMKQIPSCTCAYHGACGAGLAVGAFFSILFGATCALDTERTLSMRASNAALTAIANTGGPACCKQSVRTALLVGVEMLKEFCGVKLPISRTRCFHMKETTHGCKGVYCQFSR